VSTKPEAKQVPLVERLESIPVDARLAVDDGPYSTSFYAVGAMAHEAAAELRRLHVLNGELLEALKQAFEECIWPNERLSDVHDKARAAIARAEGKV
jgi:hypothetical protein